VLLQSFVPSAQLPLYLFHGRAPAAFQRLPVRRQKLEPGCYNHVRPRPLVASVSPEQFPDEALRPVALDGAPDFSRDAQAESVAAKIIFVVVYDAYSSVDSSAGSIYLLEVPTAPESVFGAKG
jgi:hypothetical protein